MATAISKLQECTGASSLWTSAARVLLLGEIGHDSTNDRMKVGDGSAVYDLLPEMATTVRHHSVTFDPKAVCDGTFDGLALLTVGAQYPRGIVVTSWTVKFIDGDPTTELDMDLMRADSHPTRANSAVMDVLDTTAGASSESTPGNINGGAAVANGKVIYLAFGTAYTEANHQVQVELWGYAL
jgi:hypothetical protein